MSTEIEELIKDLRYLTYVPNQMPQAYVGSIRKAADALEAKVREVNALEQTIREKNQDIAERDDEIRLLQEEVKRLKDDNKNS